MPGWWHEFTFDFLCIVNSVAAGLALIGVADVRHKLQAVIGKK